MAKYNIVLGTAVRSVGDITLYRRDGKQVARVRIREIANPKSEAQSEIRNYVAPVTKFYAPLRQALAKSFEGLNKSKSYDQFLRTNIKLAKNNEWFLDKGTPFYPMPYQLSRGSLSPLSCYIDEDPSGNEGNWTITGLTNGVQTIGNVSQALIANGYKQNDVVTPIVIYKTAEGDYVPVYFQFYVNPNDARLLSSIVPEPLHFTCYANYIVVDANGQSVDAMAVIISRKRGKEWLRSTQYLQCASYITTGLVSASRRASSIASYGPQSSEGGGSVYPDPGGEVFNCQTISGRSLLFYGGQYNAAIRSNITDKFVMLMPANLEERFYVKSTDGKYLMTNANGSLNPADWSFQSMVSSGPTEANTILYEPGSSFVDYMTSIGFTP